MVHSYKQMTAGREPSRMKGVMLSDVDHAEPVSVLRKSKIAVRAAISEAVVGVCASPAWTS